MRELLPLWQKVTQAVSHQPGIIGPFIRRSHEKILHSIIISREVLILTLSIFNIHRTLGVYFLVFPGNRGTMVNEMVSRDHIIQYTPCTLMSVFENIALGTVFLDALSKVNIRHTSSQGKHWQCSSNAMMQIDTM